jgi:DNA repair exonuclease SbcCD ATPase subunit
MKLLTLRLENFQGLKSEEFKFNGHSASIYGDNATGKTTVFNAITWLLFGKASTGAKNFTPKTKGPDGDLHYLDHAAEATFKLQDGRVITLRKVFHEVYKKKRGSATEEFDGHTIDFYIDGVPTKEKEYEATMLSLCGGSVEKMKMLTMPNYFPEEMSWDARRKILLEICGDVSDEDVINSTSELKDLPKFLLKPGTTNQYYDVEEYKKIASAKKTEINRQLQEIPGRIDEAQRAIPDITGLDPKAIDQKIQELNKQKSELETEKTQALSGDLTTMAIRKQISEANTRLAEARAAYAAKTSSLNEGTYAAINSLKRDQITVANRIQDAKADLDRTQRTIERLKSHRESLINDYMAIQKETWDESKETCPTCHRPLPEEEIQKLREAFNLQKSRRLEQINLQGQRECSKEMIAELEEKANTLREQIKKDEQLIEDYELQLKALQSQLKTPAPFESTEEYTQIMAEIAKLREEENNKSGQMEAIAAKYTEQIQALNEQIREQEQLKTKIFIAESQKERIAELAAKEKELSKQYEELERGIYLCKVFTKTKVSLLDDKINSKFKSVRFRLFQEQLNGGIKDDCEVMIPTEDGRMVPFTFANNAARINAGLEIIDTLSKHWNLAMPVFIDNAESVTRLLKMDTQVIRLVVSEPDKKLRLEVDA